jgi:hypothetical protein
MPQFSLLVQVKAPLQLELQRLLDSLEAQTNPDWELVLVVDKSRAGDWLTATQLSAGLDRVRCVLRPDGDLLAWSCNALLAGLGSWVGFLNQHDQLLPEALTEMAAAISSNPQAKVVYSDEIHRNRWGRLSYHHVKGALDGMRLRAQEYLGNLALIRTAHLSLAGGFDRLASDVPTHDLYLRTLEAYGPSAFINVPVPLCQHHRTYMEPKRTDVRQLPHLVRYDLHAVRQHLARSQLTAQVVQENGTIEVRYQHLKQPSVTAILVLRDDLTAGIERIHAFNRTLTYPSLQVRLLHLGSNPEASTDYRTLGKALGYTYGQHPADSNLPALLNQELATGDSEYLLLLDGQAINWGWLNQLVDHIQLPGVAAVGARLITPRWLTAPGILGYKFEGWDWNSRGRFNRLSVPHQTGALSPACLLLDTRQLLALGGFNETFPTLYGMDLSLKLDTAGKLLVQVPGAQIMTAVAVSPAIAERDSFVTAWTGWSDRFNLHLPL